VFAGQSVTRRQQLSDRTQKLVDEEIQASSARAIRRHGGFSASASDLHAAANGLLEHETLTGEQLRRCWPASPFEDPQTPAPAAAAMQSQQPLHANDA
jgi:cell division protease FtsH